MKNNNQLDLTKNNSNGVEMPVEKTVEEILKTIDNPLDTVTLNKEELQQIISEVKSQVRREVVEDLMKVADKYEIEDVRRELVQYSAEKGITLKN